MCWPLDSIVATKISHLTVGPDIRIKNGTEVTHVRIFFKEPRKEFSFQLVTTENSNYLECQNPPRKYRKPPRK